MQKTRNGAGRSRNLWPKKAHADTPGMRGGTVNGLIRVYRNCSTAVRHLYEPATGSFVQLIVCYGAIVPVKLSVYSNYYPEVTSGDSQ